MEKKEQKYKVGSGLQVVEIYNHVIPGTGIVYLHHHVAGNFLNVLANQGVIGKDAGSHKYKWIQSCLTLKASSQERCESAQVAQSILMTF